MRLLCKMDDFKAILHLLANFPNKSEEYLRKMYQKCNHNLNATMTAIQNEKPKKNIFGEFFENLINRFERAIGNSRQTPSTSANVLNSETATRRDEGFFEINIGEKFAQELQEKFSDSSLILPKGFQPVIEIPITLGRQLYGAYVESIFRQQEAHDQIITQPIKEDEDFTRKLQQSDDDEGLAASKIFLQEQPEDDTISYLDSFKVLKNLEISQEDKHKADLGLSVFLHPAMFYYDQSGEHLKRRQQLYEMGKQSLRFNHRIVSTIDLHHLFVKEAIETLDLFLNYEICALKNGSSENNSLLITTGTDEHSLYGIPKIKPAVIDRLRERGLRYSEINPGLLEVHIFRYSYLTSDLTGAYY